MNYAYVVFKFQEQDTKMYFKNRLAFNFLINSMEIHIILGTKEALGRGILA